MKLDIVLPTRNRPGKLSKCINSFEYELISNEFIEINAYIYVSTASELEAYNRLYASDRIKIKIFENYRVPDFWNSHLLMTNADAMVYVNDDIEFLPGTVGTIVKQMTCKFPDYDGVLGLNQCNLKKEQALESAFGVIGIKYADRFPNRQVFCPDYYRFYADQELLNYAKFIDKFYWCESAKIHHYHPCTDKNLEDDTHHNVRQYLKKDKIIYSQRFVKDWMWGNNFDLLRKENNEDFDIGSN